MGLHWLGPVSVTRNFLLCCHYSCYLAWSAALHCLSLHIWPFYRLPSPLWRSPPLPCADSTHLFFWLCFCPAAINLCIPCGHSPYAQTQPCLLLPNVWVTQSKNPPAMIVPNTRYNTPFFSMGLAQKKVSLDCVCLQKSLIFSTYEVLGGLGESLVHPLHKAAQSCTKSWLVSRHRTWDSILYR